MSKDEPPITLRLLGILLGVVVVYFIIWVMVYPMIGYRCLKKDTIISAEVYKDGAWGTDYKVTFTDGSTDIGSGNLYKGKEVCRDYTADFPW